MRRWYGTSKWDPVVVRRDTTHHTWSVRTPKDIQLTVKPSRHGLGCFVDADIPAQSCVGVYPGQIISDKRLALKMGQLPFEQQRAVGRYLVQSRLHSTDKSCCYLDPTGPHGGLDKTFVDNPALYLNEPDTDQTTNVHSVWNYDTGRLELWTSRDVKAGEELLVHYGTSYARDYAGPQGNAAVCVMRDGALRWED